MVYEVVDNAIDEALAGYCDTVTVTLNADGSCTVTDNGRGIPVDIHEEEGVSAAEVIMTQLHAGGKFNQNSLQGLGRAARGRRLGRQRAVRRGSTCASSAAGRNGSCGSATACRRRRSPRSVRPRSCRPGSSREGRTTGTEITFLPSTETFTKTEFDFTTLEHRLRELAFLNSGVTLVLSDLRGRRAEDRHLAFRGRPRSLCPLSRPLEAGAARAADRDPRRARGHRRSRSRWSGPTAITRRCSASPTTSRSATAAPISPASARR